MNQSRRSTAVVEKRILGGNCGCARNHNFCMIDFCRIRLLPMKRNLLFWSGLLVAVAGLPALLAAQNSKRLTVPGINNFWFVDKTVSTGGSIMSRDLAMPALKKRGIKTVIDLAGGAESDAERAAAEAAGMKYLVFAINPMTLDPAPIDPFLKAASDAANLDRKGVGQGK